MDELLTPAEMAEADRRAIAGGIAGIDLMERAGQAVADAVCEMGPPTGPVVVVAGAGNNGGDGFIAARVLRERGWSVRLVLMGDRERLRGDAALAAERWTGSIESAASADLAGASVIIDALFGAGLSRPVEGEARGLIERINAQDCPVVAVDLPSGIDGETGAVRGSAVRATRSVTFFRKKPGHVLLPGRIFCGRITVHDIGIPEAVLQAIAPRVWLNRPALWRRAFPIPQVEGHKYSRGHAVVLSGPMPNTGAARLAARGASRAGAGLVTVACETAAAPVHAAALDSIMVRRVDTASDWRAMLADRRIRSLVLGPAGGVGERLRQMVEVAAEGQAALVLDADALTSFASGPEMLFSFLRTRTSGTVLTPHDGEFDRLFKSDDQASDFKSKLMRARQAAKVAGAIIILKGADTVVAPPDGRAAIADNAPPWLATGGAGDVLAGIAAGLLAQGMPAFEAACAAVWLHGEAAQEAGPGLIADDLPDALRAVYRRLFASFGD